MEQLNSNPQTGEDRHVCMCLENITDNRSNNELVEVASATFQSQFELSSELSISVLLEQWDFFLK